MIPALSAALALGRKLQGSETLIQEMLGVSLQALATDAIFVNFEPDSKLSSEQWKSISGSLSGNLPEKDQFLYSLENELSFALNSIDIAFRQNKRTSLIPGWIHIPGVLDREVRILKNGLSRQIDMTTKGVNQSTIAPPPSSYSDYFLGRNGYLANTFIPNFSRAESQMTMNSPNWKIGSDQGEY